MIVRRNIMRRFRITEISAVDTPCQVPAVAAIFKRAEKPAADATEASPAPSATDWRGRREMALQRLQSGADALAKRYGLGGAAAYDRFLATPEGRALYAATL